MTNEHETACSKPCIANPGPLGLCGFALTTFVLSSANAGLYEGSQIVLGLAFFYGGLAQLFAGMWEFKTGNTFGATAFSSYGAFWMSLGYIIQQNLIPNPHAMAFFLLGWTIFTAIMLLASLKTNGALIAVFGLLTITFALLAIGDFGWWAPAHQMGGWFGLATAFAAWYLAAAGLMAAGPAAFKLPIWPVE